MNLIAALLFSLCGAAQATTLCVLGDSISTHNNGASAAAWPRLLEEMIADSGVRDVSVHNYSVPGLTWRSAREPTPGLLIAGTATPVQALLADRCDCVLVMLGVNDRGNAQAINDAAALDALLPMSTLYLSETLWVDADTAATVVTADERLRMISVYQALGYLDRSVRTINLGMLYQMGMTYDGLHPTNTGKQWIAAGVYEHLQARLPLTPIMRNIAWLWSIRGTAEFAQMMNVPR